MIFPCFVPSPASLRISKRPPDLGPVTLYSPADRRQGLRWLFGEYFVKQRWLFNFVMVVLVFNVSFYDILIKTYG